MRILILALLMLAGSGCGKTTASADMVILGDDDCYRVVLKGANLSLQGDPVTFSMSANAIEITILDPQECPLICSVDTLIYEDMDGNEEYSQPVDTKLDQITVTWPTGESSYTGQTVSVSNMPHNASIMLRTTIELCDGTVFFRDKKLN